jgi:hypothetical protein
MTPEQLYDSLATVLGKAESPGKGRRKAGAARKGSPTASRERFVDFFQPPAGADPSEYPSGIPQVLQLMNAPEMNRGGALLDELVRPGRSLEANIERLYLATLGRRPRAVESARLADYLKEPGRSPREGYDDLLWVLLNSSEFALNH